MPKTIYHLLSVSFWTARKCSACAKFFTEDDYSVQNTNLTFTKLLKTNPQSLELAIELSHKSCCSNCVIYLKDIVQKPCSTPILKK